MSEQQRSPLAGDDDVEGHGTRGFRGADAEQAEDDDVEGHARRQGGF
jgi:hypothetical protein